MNFRTHPQTKQNKFGNKPIPTIPNPKIYLKLRIENLDRAFKITLHMALQTHPLLNLLFGLVPVKAQAKGLVWTEVEY